MLQALARRARRSVVASTAASQIREFELRLRFDFRVRTRRRQGAAARRARSCSSAILTYTESAALAKEQEEAFLYRAMQSDIVSQVLRRLASVRLVLQS